MNIAHKAFHALFSPPRSTPQSKVEDHSQDSKNPPAAPTAPAPSKPNSERRCQFTYSDGRRCGNERAPLCVHHASTQREPRTKGVPDAAPNSPELAALRADLTTTTNINRALTETFLLMAQGRISRKDAVAFGYLTQLLLQTVPGVRAEFVAAFGYRQWEERLKNSLEAVQSGNQGSPGADTPLDPGPSGNETKQPMKPVVERQKGVPITSLLAQKKVEPKKGVGITPFFRHEEVEPQKAPRRERHGDQESRIPGIADESAGLRGAKEEITPFFRHEEVEPQKEVAEPVTSGPAQSPANQTSSPDYESIVSRSVALLDRRYDFTPEGRREAKALALELELMKPQDSKPPKGRFGEVVALVRRLRAGKNPPPAAAPWLDSNGEPIKPTAAYPREWWEPKPDPASAKSMAIAGPEPPASPVPSTAANPGPPTPPAVTSQIPPVLPSVEALSAQTLSPNPTTARRIPRDYDFFSPRLAEPEAKPGDGYFAAPPCPGERRASRRPEEPGLPVGRRPEEPELPAGRVDWLPPAPNTAPKPKQFLTKADKFARRIGQMSNYKLRHFFHSQHSQGS